MKKFSFCNISSWEFFIICCMWPYVYHVTKVVWSCLIFIISIADENFPLTNNSRITVYTIHYIGHNYTDCTDGDIRLVGGYNEHEGTIEVCYNQLWGLINDNRWNEEAANVICRQLGYDKANSKLTFIIMIIMCFSLYRCNFRLSILSS